MNNKEYFFEDFFSYYKYANKKSISIYDQIIKEAQETLSDEEILEKMDLKTIENFLRKKKLNNIAK